LQLKPLRESRFFLSLRTAGAFFYCTKSQALYRNSDFNGQIVFSTAQGFKMRPVLLF